MRRISVLAIGLVIIIVAAATIVVVYTRMSSARVTTVRIEPESVGQLSVDDTFTVNVTVENCADIYAVQCDVRYDPEVLNAINVSEGSFLRSAGLTTFLSTPNETLNTTSSLSARVFFVDTKSGLSLPDASGNGVLLTITFQVIAGGSSELQVFPYPGGDAAVGTYFMRRDKTEIIPELHDSSYAGPP
ncbi:MAG: cohesin domain-containing protein [Candidatus Bathyarchaeia archaeon]|jgi:flagellar basal body-associated protein FliL